MRPTVRSLLPQLLAAAALAACLPDAPPAWDRATAEATVGREVPAIVEGPEESSNETILRAWAAGRSDVWVEGSGEVVRVLSDDLEGSRHQRLIVEVADGHTVLVSHNIDLAPKVPVHEGQRIGFRGEYEWNERGGVVHWTHHDPRGRRQGGYIDSGGKRYR